MKRSLLPILLCLLTLHVSAQQTRERIPGFLNPEDLPNAARYLATPPKPDDEAFMNDRYYYSWGKEQRKTPQGVRAAIDEVQKTHEAFSPAAGFNISPENTPEIFRLVEGARRDARTTNRKAKDYFQRTRPFVYFQEPSINPETDEEYKTSYSFPSGHSVRGWIYALTLALIVPDSTEALIARAQEFAINRVICGRHWKSDIDASLVEATAIMSRLLTNAAFLEQLEKARKEYACLRKE